MIAPVLAEIAEEYRDRVTVAKVNVDNEPDLAMKYNVTGIPLLGVFKNGEMVKQLVGARPKAALALIYSKMLMRSVPRISRSVKSARCLQLSLGLRSFL